MAGGVSLGRYDYCWSFRPSRLWLSDNPLWLIDDGFGSDSARRVCAVARVDGFEQRCDMSVFDRDQDPCHLISPAVDERVWLSALAEEVRLHVDDIAVAFRA